MFLHSHPTTCIRTYVCVYIYIPCLSCWFFFSFSSPPGCVDNKTGFNNTNLQLVAFISAEDSDSELRLDAFGRIGEWLPSCFWGRNLPFGEFPWNIHPSHRLLTAERFPKTRVLQERSPGTLCSALDFCGFFLLLKGGDSEDKGEFNG